MENKTETTTVYWSYVGIMENKMETTIVYWGYVGIMENKIETTIVCSRMVSRDFSALSFWACIFCLSCR